MSKKSRIVRTNPITDKISNAIPKKPKIRSLVEMIGWILGIMVSLIVIWQTFFPNIFKANPNDEISNSISANTDTATQLNPILKPDINKNNLTDTSVLNKPIPKKEISKRKKEKPDTILINNGFLNQGGVGNTYNQTINPKAEPRRLNNEDIDTLNRLITRKDYRVTIISPSNLIDSEAFEYANQIIQYLNQIDIVPSHDTYNSISSYLPGRFNLEINDYIKAAAIRIYPLKQ